MAYNHGKEERRWRIWKDSEEVTLRKYGVDESTIEQIRAYDREIFNSDRRFYQRLQETDTYLDTVAESEQHIEVKTIVLPQGRFNNSSDRAIREFIAERCRILAVVGLHGNVFKPHTGTKTSVLFVQKWDDELCPKKDDYPIFFATMQKPSKDNSGDKIYLKDPDTGENALDEHGHLIVDHDLYQLSYKKQDGTIVKLKPGIAEAFAEFAKKERFSFFQ